MKTRTGILVQRSGRFAALAGCAVAAVGLALSGCAAVATGSYVNSRVGLTPYTTVHWGPTDEVETGDPRLDNNPFFYDRVRDGIERGLTARGYEFAPSDTPDLLVHVHVSMTQAIDAALIDVEYCADGDCRPAVYDMGTLVVDLVDPDSNTLVWRGWAESALGEFIDNQTAMERQVDESVAQILARLPVRPQG